MAWWILPEGKMKSREGTVIDADDLMADVIEEARLAAGDREMTDPEIIRGSVWPR